jgi:hypothetical protein
MSPPDIDRLVQVLRDTDPGETSFEHVLDEVAAAYRRYVVAPLVVMDAAALWSAHSHCFDIFELSPLLAVSSPVERSGKTTMMKVLERLTPRPWRVITPSEAVVFRKIARDTPTLLLDEYDAIFAQKEHEPLRAILNAGNEPGTTVPRCVGPKLDLMDYPIFCPKVLAGIGRLPRTVDDRAIKLRLKRKADGEAAMKYRRREAREFLSPLQERLAAWVEENVEAIAGIYPTLPEGLNDRAEDCWEPLIAIADVADGSWPERARTAALALSRETDDEDDHAKGVVLLTAIQQVRAAIGGVAIFTADLLQQLAADEESLFAEWWDVDRAKPARGAPRELASLLRPFEIHSKKVKIDGRALQGYHWAAFEDAFSRYPGQKSGTSGTLAQPSQKQATLIRNQEPAGSGFEEGSNPHECTEVPEVPDFGPPGDDEYENDRPRTFDPGYTDPDFDPVREELDRYRALLSRGGETA